MRRLASRDRARSLGIATAIVIAIAAGAIGYWTGNGSGTAQTTLGNPLALSLSPGTPGTLVSPGAGAAVATVASNPNPHTVHISSISLDTDLGTNGFAVDAGHSGCDLSALGFTTQTNGGAGWTVPAGSPGSLSIALPDAMTMAADASNACQGATFTVYLEAAV